MGSVSYSWTFDNLTSTMVLSKILPIHLSDIFNKNVQTYFLEFQESFLFIQGWSSTSWFKKLKLTATTAVVIYSMGTRSLRTCDPWPMDTWPMDTWHGECSAVQRPRRTSLLGRRRRAAAPTRPPCALRMFSQWPHVCTRVKHGSSQRQQPAASVQSVTWPGFLLRSWAFWAPLPISPLFLVSLLSFCHPVQFVRAIVEKLRPLSYQNMYRFSMYIPSVACFHWLSAVKLFDLWGTS